MWQIPLKPVMEIYYVRHQWLYLTSIRSFAYANEMVQCIGLHLGPEISYIPFWPQMVSKKASWVSFGQGGIAAQSPRNSHTWPFDIHQAIHYLLLSICRSPNSARCTGRKSSAKKLRQPRMRWLDCRSQLQSSSHSMHRSCRPQLSR